MIAYFDTSALVPLLVDETGSASCEQVWSIADDVVTVDLSWVETAAALAQACRMGRIDDNERTTGLSTFTALWAELSVTESSDELLRRAAELSHEHSLRAYDAVHCAAAEQVAAPDLVVAAGDRALLRACRSIGLVTADVNHVG